MVFCFNRYDLGTGLARYMCKDGETNISQTDDPAKLSLQGKIQSII